MAEKFDIVIIGSGAGGAPIAAELAALEGSRTCGYWCLRRVRSSDAGRQPGRRHQRLQARRTAQRGPEKRINLGGDGNVGRSFYSSHIEPDLNDEPHLWSDHGEQNPRVTVEGYTAQVVGGGTQLYGAVSLRFPERDFMLASAQRPAGLPDDPYADPEVDIKDWPITYARSAALLREGRDAGRHQRQHQRCADRGTRPAEAVSERLLPEAGRPEPDQPVRPGRDEEDRRAGLPHSSRRHHRGPCPQRPARAGMGQDGLRQPLRRPARLQVQYLGFSASPRDASISRPDRPAVQLHGHAPGSERQAHLQGALPRCQRVPEDASKARSWWSPVRRSNPSGC